MLNTIEELEKYIKWSIQTPGTLFDGWIMTDDEIKRMAESIFNLAIAGGMNSGIDWRDCLVYLYYERYHHDDEYIGKNGNIFIYRSRPIYRNNVVSYFKGICVCAQKEQLEYFINDLFSLSICGDLVEAKYLMQFMILSILAEKIDYVLHEIHRTIDILELYMLVQCSIDNKNIEITKVILEYMIKEVNHEISRKLVESLILYANKNENYEMQTVLMEFKDKYNLYQSDTERQKKWAL